MGGGSAMRRTLSVALAVALATVARGDWEPPMAPRCPPDKGSRCNHTDGGEYFVDGKSIVIEFSIGNLFRLQCRGGAVLESDALPRFEQPQAVLTVQLHECPAPRNASYARALAALGIVGRTEERRGYENLVIKGQQPEHFPALAHHLDGLDALLRLTLEARNCKPAPSVTRPLLEGRLASLLALRLDRVELAADALPAALRELQLVARGAAPAAMPAAVLRRLPLLATLLLDSDAGASVDAGAASGLTALTVRASKGPVRLAGPVPANLTKLELRWGSRSLDLRPRGLQVDAEAAAQLAGWLAECPPLRELRVHGPLGAVPAALLEGQRALRTLSLARCELTELPERLLDWSDVLEDLDLSFNRLRRLPAQLFGGPRRLSVLNLSHNQLEASAVAVVGTAPANTLHKLRLEYNPLGDLCRGGGASDVVWADTDSALNKLLSLEELYLSNTGVIRVCRDWRQSMQNLTKLDLQYTKITQLSYSEMQYRRRRPSFVYMNGIPLDNLEYSREDYASGSSPPALVTVSMRATLRCDCRQYWAALALRHGQGGVLLQTVTCDGVPIERVDPERLTCNASDLCPALPAGCECRVRPDLAAPGSHARLTCERAGLDAVPPVHGAAAHAWTMRLAGNRIAALPRAALPPVLRELDLSNNSVSRISAALLSAHPEARLRVGGNPLDCRCGAHEDLDALRRSSARVEDFADASCEGGGRLVVPGPCALWEWVAGGAALAVVALAGVAAAAVLSRPEARLRLKVGLARLGWLPRDSSAAEAGLRFDAFVSYAHQDEVVVCELAARLEGGRAPLRLCLHERDWMPGGWIPTQIAASVRSSRCTLAVLSEHYVRSGWARAEFREAHAASLRDARPRLVVVLLAAPDALPLDDELRDYLAANTYVRWGDPWFWEKLRVALCPAPAPAPADAARAESQCCFFRLVHDAYCKRKTVECDKSANETKSLSKSAS